ncbi:MAG TPA: adenylate/guanylate cyclase domain-containing protein [Myxococcales bacterium]|nr:adenylate/guanylate cyclase domain-containing protein [Myxococcales bacterium]
MPVDLDALSFTELVQLQNSLGETLKRRFEKQLCLCFSDVVGSTPYFARFGDAAGRGLQQRHLDLLAQALKDHGGRVVDTAGDGAFTVFPSAEKAANAFIALENLISAQNQGYAREHQLVVRVGIHWGPALSDGTSVSGDSVNFASRIAGSGGPGEIRLSKSAYRELSTEKRLRCRGLPPAALKGIGEPQELMVLEWRDRNMFPKAARVVETGEEIALPMQDTITFGRLRERNGIVANDVVLALPDPEQSKSISRWHFELRRGEFGFLLRSVTDQTTEVDGVMLAKSAEAPIKPGSRVRLAKVMTIEFLGEVSQLKSLTDITNYTP